jgi:hypothetical protein
VAQLAQLVCLHVDTGTPAELARLGQPPDPGGPVVTGPWSLDDQTVAQGVLGRWGRRREGWGANQARRSD